MKLVSDKTAELRSRIEKAKAGGGAEKAAAQRRAGKLLARERIDDLLDEDSFQELGALVRPQSREFGLDRREMPADGVVTGIGRIHGRSVCVFSQDFTVLGGTLGLAHARKICRLMELAIDSGAPIIGLCDTGGPRIQEGVDALAGYAEIFTRNVLASGRVPQISAILGPCAGGAAYSPALTDFVFMVKGISRMFINGPEVILAEFGEDVDGEALGGAEMHARRAGTCHFMANSEQDCFRQIRDLLEYLPQNCFEHPKALAPSDDPLRDSALLDKIAHEHPHRPYDMRELIREIADGRSFLEVHKEFARNVLAGFLRLDGAGVGVVANDPERLSGALDILGSEKAARFVRLCDSFNIPLLTLVDVPGYWPALEQAEGGIIRHGAKLLYAYCESTVPKVAVVLRKAYGGAYDILGSKHVRGDVNFAWPCAEIAVVGPQGAIGLLFKDEIAASPDPKKRRSELMEEYVKKFASAKLAAERGYIDEIIEPAQTRRKLISAFRFLRSKAAGNPTKKHGNIPL
ncbi:MAG: acyl-CoA carboxylase subunit beta [Elusimicrobia bacterium]|nr:acyl-CoA carboxylase subunit beta [Elusimicrobiota bacterium]